MTQQRRIGLTGGIATGKTTVANYLATVHQLPLLDADRYAREAVQPGSEILQRIIDRYGPALLSDLEGHLDRQRLGNIVFNNPEERHWLEQQIHPYVEQCFVETVKALHDQPTLVLVIPLLFEAHLTHRVTETWVVTCDAEVQRQRLIQRDHLSPDQADARIHAQMPLSEKCALADVVIHNDRTIAELQQQADRALSQVLLTTN
jgi:dephospho-CoA kinase